jgi:hypothetical protein
MSDELKRAIIAIDTVVDWSAYDPTDVMGTFYYAELEFLFETPVEQENIEKDVQAIVSKFDKVKIAWKEVAWDDPLPGEELTEGGASRYGVFPASKELLDAFNSLYDKYHVEIVVNPTRGE